MSEPDSLSQAMTCLEGLSVGDAFGQQFFIPGILETCSKDRLPPAPWHYTDDTIMAMAIIHTLKEQKCIDQDVLATEFTERYWRAPNRGYGAGAQQLLRAIHEGTDWRVATKDLFHGTGSYGNGAAMRVAPVGAWFADDENQVIEQARLSAEVTHSHPEGIAGAIAVALAACWIVQKNRNRHQMRNREFLPWIIERIESSEVRQRLEWAATYPLTTWPFTVASQVGNGMQITAQDTVPFCLWMTAAYFDQYTDAMWMAARNGGDMDTNCAIIGGLLALSNGPDAIPETWKHSRESLKW